MGKLDELRKLLIEHCAAYPRGEASEIARAINIAPGQLSDFKRGTRDLNTSACANLAAELKRRAQCELDAPISGDDESAAALREIGRQLRSLGELLLSPHHDLRLQAQWLVGRIDELKGLRGEIVRLYLGD